MADDPNNRAGNKEVHGASTVTPVAPKRNWLPWILGALALLLLLFLLSRCGHKQETAVTNTTTTTETSTTNTTGVATTNSMTAGAATPPVGVKDVTLPNGKVVSLEPNTLNYSLQDYLASTRPTPQTFTFDRLNFATASAELPADAQPTLSALQQILAAYPKAKVRIEGYADARGTDPANKDLGARRAAAVAAALVGEGVDKGRIATATGGEENPIATNATAAGMAENRRTDLVVTAK